MTHDPRALRNAFGWFATGVAIVTTKVAGKDPIGITVNSFSSVSLDPPLVLWCLDKGSDTIDTFEACEAFTVNILSEDQKHLSNELAKSGDHSLAEVATSTGENGCPRIEEALAVFECELYARHDAGDHIILIGQIKAFSSEQEGRPLVYHRGGYQALGA
jgi:flavin reductase (DIM6/NTAB) family NADH-FMN oxidoreductase RutF